MSLIGDLVASVVASMPDGTFPSLATVKYHDGTRLPGGKLDDSPGHWMNLAGHVNLKCRVAPIVKERPTGREDRNQRLEVGIQDEHLVFQGYYPGIKRNHRIVLDDGRDFNVIDVDHDGNKVLTRLRIEKLTV